MSHKVTVTISARDANDPRAILDRVLKTLQAEQVEVAIAVEPDAEPTREEALDLFRSGRAVELDAAFAGIAGVTEEEWRARVAAHRPPPPGA